MSFTFANPAFLLLLLALPGWLVWYLGIHRQRQARIRLSYDAGQMSPRATRLALLAWLPRTLVLAGLALLILALARPQREEAVTEDYAVGLNLMLDIDVSESMETRDFLPNRLEVAKQVAAKFVESLQQDRVGVVVFAEAALIYTPLTLDYEYLQNALAQLHTNLMPKQGTALGDAIGMSLNVLDRESRTGNGVIILLTDGASNRGEIGPRSAAAVAARRGVKIYAIGIGQPKMQTESGATQTTEADETVLREVAQTTGGRFYRATDRDALVRIFEEIGRLEKTRVGTRYVRQTVELYFPFLLAGLLASVTGLLLAGLGLSNPLEEA